MTALNTLLLDRDSLGGEIDLAPLTQLPIDLQTFTQTAPAEVTERIRDAEIVISNKVILDRNSLQQARQLKLICVAATGTNNVDLQAASDLGIKVCNVVSYSTPSVVQHVFSALLAIYSQQNRYQQAVSAGRWQQSPYFCLFDAPIHELAGQTLGIVGYGELGQGVAKAAEAFGMRILISQRPGSNQPQPERLLLHELLPQLDVLSLHCPLTPETRHLIGANELALMKPSALLINTARGGIVDERALATALREGQIGGAVVDVLSEEPPINGNPLLQSDIPNLILTPHMAWGSVESRQRLIAQLALNINAFLSGTPRNVVNN